MLVKANIKSDIFIVISLSSPLEISLLEASR